jgi:hypothetical protein
LNLEGWPCVFLGSGFLSGVFPKELIFPFSRRPDLIMTGTCPFQRDSLEVLTFAKNEAFSREVAFHTRNRVKVPPRRLPIPQ